MTYPVWIVHGISMIILLPRQNYLMTKWKKTQKLQIMKKRKIQAQNLKSRSTPSKSTLEGQILSLFNSPESMLQIDQQEQPERQGRQQQKALKQPLGLGQQGVTKIHRFQQ